VQTAIVPTTTASKLTVHTGLLPAAVLASSSIVVVVAEVEVVECPSIRKWTECASSLVKKEMESL
jgi:hypothetical protein